MSGAQVRVNHVARPPADPGLGPVEDEPGPWLAQRVREALEERRAGPVAVVVRDLRLDLVSLHDGLGPMAPFLAALTRASFPRVGEAADQDPVRAVGVAGRFLARRPGDRVPAPVALAFLEWPDCRWWCWRALLDSQGRLLPDGEQVTSALEGDPLLPGLGRWWSLQRRSGVEVRFGTVAPDPAPSSPHVH